MRAGRLFNLVLILQRRDQVTAAELATELEVSVRTVLRDLAELSDAGVPIHATRGRGGGFQMLGEHQPELGNVAEWVPTRRLPATSRRVVVRITVEGRRRAAALRHLQPLRVRRSIPPGADGWFEATIRLQSFEGLIADVLSLGPHVEVLEPTRLRSAVAERSTRTADLYRSSAT